MRASTAVSMRPILSMIALALALFGAASTRADENDPPARVARLGFIQGSVSFNPAGTQDWVAAPVNRPLTTGDQLWADRGGRAELQLDGSSLRLGASTSMAFLNLSDQATQVQLTAGTLLVHVRHLYDQETYEIDTPNLAFTVLRAGTYRVTVDENAGTTTINVRRGQGEVTGGGTAYSLYEGEDDVFAGTDQLTETAQYQSPAPDSLDAWSDGRDNRWDNSASARYVSPDVVGYQDLDDHGSWTATPEYGHVWIPRGVEPGWAPYQSGHWAYVPPWGYTWVDDQPWGFAPFHYGRWIHTGQAWGWCPAPPPGPDVVYVRPVYAPALVAWVTVGAGVAWFALGPREVYVPSYPVSREYVNAVNVSNTTVNTTIVNNVYNTTIINKTANNTNITYVNRNAPGAIVATSREAFASAAPVARNRLPVDTRAAAAAPVRAVAPPVVPTRQAVIGPSRAAPARPPASVIARPVVARTPPPPPPPSFEQHLRALQSNGGRPLSVAQVRQLAPLPAAARAAPVKLAPPAKTLITPRPAAAAPRPAAELTNRPAEPNRPAPPAPARPPVQTTPPRPPAPAAPPPAPAVAARAPEPAAAPHPAPAPPPHPAPAVTHVSEMPPMARGPSPAEASSALERQHLQEQQRLQAQQSAERQRIQQQQEAEHQRLVLQQADQARQRQQAQIEQQHQQQTQELQQRHALEQQQMAQRQQQQRVQQQVQPAPPRPAAAPPRPPPTERPAAPSRQPPNERPSEPPRR